MNKGPYIGSSYTNIERVLETYFIHYYIYTKGYTVWRHVGEKQHLP